MRPGLKRVSAFSVIALATVFYGAKMKSCNPEPAAPCYNDDCLFTYCLGPENITANAPVYPRTCNGDFFVTVSALAWKGDQDGMEYAIKNQVFADDSLTQNADLNNLVDSEYQSPSRKFQFGFKLGFGYKSVCDGWDMGFLWTHFYNKTKTHDEAEFNDNSSLLPLWSSFQYPNAGQAPILFVTDIATRWELGVNLFDLELGRQFWVSRRLNIRPYMGIRIAYLDQEFDIEYRGGSFNDPGFNGGVRFNDEVELKNKYKGVGIRSGLGSVWNVHCGFSLYGDLAASIVYGRFDVDHEEYLREAQPPFNKTKLLDTGSQFYASRAVLDLALGVQWSAMVWDGKYGVTVSLGWEYHNFFHQNQLWRVNRVGGNGSQFLNNTGENVHHQRRGTLGTQGLSLTGNFAF